MRRRFDRACRGFTLVELIAAMVIIGIIAGTVALLIRRPIEQYVAIADRAELVDAAESALRLMARDLRGALPNSVRVSNPNGVWLLELIPATAGGMYLEPGDTAGAALNFTNPVSAPFTVLTVDPVHVGDYIVISNYGAGFPQQDAYQSGADNGNRAIIRELLVGNQILIDDDTSGAAAAPYINVFARSAVSTGSPNRRFSIIGQPLTYRCVPPANNQPGRLLRVSNYGFNANQQDPGDSGLVQLVALNVRSCDFTSLVTPHRNASLVTLRLSLRKSAANAEQVDLFRVVHLDNTP